MERYPNGSGSGEDEGAYTRALIRRINSLQPVYRDNFVRWLERFSDERMTDLEEGLNDFLSNQSPHMRGMYLNSLIKLADEACRYFGMLEIPEG